ncbi:DNA methyltransferase, partial [Bacteroides thetaiotaomicron]|uniref:DNA methyltransferase n=1 Tax=Bacteroides thetaiotaomicron TaxID=818 RepID=UPI000A96811A
YTNKEIPSSEYFTELYRVSKRQIIWGCQYMMEYLEKGGSFIVWDKGADPDKHNMSACDIAWNSKRERIRIFKGHWCGAVKFVNETTIHPHQKPIPLYSWILKNYANLGDKILDTHLGSGSSRIAAYKLDFDFYATEIDKDYFEAQEERFRHECFGEIKTKKGTLVQTSLFGV